MWCPKCGTGQCIDKVYVCENLLVPANCPGQFECGTGQCIDKVYVSDNHSQSADHSDEISCHGHHGKGISAWLIAIFVIIAVALFMLFLVTMTLVCLKYVVAGVCNTGYTRV